MAECKLGMLRSSVESSHLRSIGFADRGSSSHSGRDRRCSCEVHWVPRTILLRRCNFGKVSNWNLRLY